MNDLREEIGMQLSQMGRIVRSRVSGDVGRSLGGDGGRPTTREQR